MNVFRLSIWLDASARSITLTQMHGCSGITSHWPWSVPPHAQLRICFGQVCGHTYSMDPSTQLPQFWQPKTSFFE